MAEAIPPWERYPAQQFPPGPWVNYPQSREQSDGPLLQEAVDRYNAGEPQPPLTFQAGPDWNPADQPNPLHVGGAVVANALHGLAGIPTHAAAFLQGIIPGMFTKRGFGGTYQDSLRNQEALRNVLPEGFRNQLQLAGALAPALVTGGATLPGAVARAVAPTVPATAVGRALSAAVPRLSTATNPVGRLPENAIIGGTVGLGGGLVTGFLDPADADLNERAQNAADFGGPGAVGGVAIGAALPLAGFAASRFGRRTPSSPDAPTLSGPRFSEDVIKDTSQSYRTLVRALYDEVDASGFRVARNEIDDIWVGVMDEFEEALGRNTGAAPPAAGSPEAVLNDLIERTAMQGVEGVPLGKVERWRQRLSKQINNAYRGGRGDDAELLEVIRDALDDNILQLTEQGSPARQAYRTSLQMRALEDAATRAADDAVTSSMTYEELFRRNLKRLKRTRQWDRFDTAQRQAITDAIRARGPMASIEKLTARVFGSGLGRQLVNTAGAGMFLATGNVAGLAPGMVTAADRITSGLATNRALTGAVDAVSPPPRKTHFGFPPLLGEPLTPALAPVAGQAARQYRTGGGF